MSGKRESVSSSIGSASFTLLEPRSRFGDKLPRVRLLCPQNGTAVLRDTNEGTYRGGEEMTPVITASMSRSTWMKPFTS